MCYVPIDGIVEKNNWKIMKNELQSFEKIAQQLLEAEESEPVIKPRTPEELYRDLDLGLEEEAIESDRLHQALEQLVLATPRTSSKMFFNQLYGGRQAESTLGELSAVMLNSSMYTYKVGGPQILIEQEIIKRCIELAGYDQDAGGTIAPGGSMTNLMAMIMARDKFDRAIRKEGVSSKMTLYTSVTSHYSIPKNASFMGVGRNQIRFIETDKFGQMSPDDLEEKIRNDLESGLQPFLVVATAGTTVMGSFDPIESISKVADKYQLWLHVDGAYCGSVIFSEKYRSLIKGVDSADSFSLNAHKMLGVPLSCSLILVKDKKDLYTSFANSADYLYQTADDDLNPGKISLQCGRRNDALKFWTLWKSRGTKGLAKAVDHQFHLAQIARDYVKNHKDYTLYNYDNTVSVCFNYKGISAEKICTLLYEQGEIMVGFGSFNGETFVRLVTINFSLTDDELMNFFKKFESFVETHILISR